MAWSPPAHNAESFGFQHPETTPPFNSNHTPDGTGETAGTQLIEAAKESGVGALELWCFQANARACRFYEARGFFAIRFTDGEENEEKTPDIRYRWEPGADH